MPGLESFPEKAAANWVSLSTALTFFPNIFFTTETSVFNWARVLSALSLNISIILGSFDNFNKSLLSFTVRCWAIASGGLPDLTLSFCGSVKSFHPFP